MSNSKLQQTRDYANFARIAPMIYGPCTDVIRDILRKEISPSNLEEKVRVFRANKKIKTFQIDDHRLKTVYGQDYSKFDIKLIYFLLRNFCRIRPHSNGWGNYPHRSDKSVSANIERIRLIRNYYACSLETSMSDLHFDEKFEEIYLIVKELEEYLGCSTKYQEKVKELKTLDLIQTSSKLYLDIHI